MKAVDLYQDAKEILGTCDPATFYQKLTDAIQVLANKGNWDILTQWVDICACSGGRTITLPREIDTPLSVNVDGHPLYFRNVWAEYHLNGLGSCQPTPWTWDDKGDAVTFLDIIKAAYLVLLVDLKTDRGVVVRVYGYDENSKWIRTQEPDGTWKDGMVIPPRMLSDFQSGIIVPDTLRVFKRNFTFGRLVEFLSATAHQMVTGEPAVVSLVAAPMPTPLQAGITYFIRAIDATTISLHATQYGAQQNTDVILITAAQNTSQIRLRDTRGAKVFTQFNTATAHGFLQSTIVVFSAATMPDPLLAGTQYFAHVIDTNNFTVHETVDEAIDNVNPIDVVTPGAAVVASARQPLAPITILNFTTNHNFMQGDAVQVANSTGQYPSPLLPGVTYYVRYLTATSISLHVSIADATSGENPIVLLSSGSGTTSVVKTMSATASIGTANNITCVGHNLSTPVYPAAVGTVNRARNLDTSTINTSAPHGLNNGDYVKVSGMGDVSYNTASAQVTVTGPSVFTYNNIGVNELVTADAAGTIEVVPAKGDFVQFSTQGGFPNPITQNTAYRAEPPMSADTFTLYDTSPAVVDILTVGYGQLFCILSRTVAIGFNNEWRTDATNLATGDAVKVYSTGTLPTCVPAINTTSTYYMRKLNANTVELYDTYAHATGAPATTGRITVAAVGSGDIYLVLERNVSAIPASSQMVLSSSQFLQDGATVQFETDGTLPGPLALTTNYIMRLVNGFMQVQTMAGVDVTLTTIGSGEHTMVISRVLGLQLPTYVDVPKNNYDDGMAVIAQSDGTIPTPLINNGGYYLRRISDDHVEIYDTLSHAQNLSSTVGRIVLTNAGSGTHIFYQLLPNFKFQRITRIEKSPTDGFVMLYAYDEGRNNPLTLIGNYFPDETEPMYRRINIQKCCAWVRIRFRRRLFQITTMQDFIPLKSRMAIITMMKSLKMLNTEFSTQAQAYEDKALLFLQEEQEASDGPDVTPSIQFNSDIFTNPDDEQME